MPLAVFLAYFRHLLPIGPHGNRFSSKRNVLVWKVIMLVTYLTPFLERFNGNLFVFRTQERERDDKKECDYFFHRKKLVINVEKIVPAIVFVCFLVLDSKKNFLREYSIPN